MDQLVCLGLRISSLNLYLQIEDEDTAHTFWIHNFTALQKETNRRVENEDLYSFDKQSPCCSGWVLYDSGNHR